MKISKSKTTICIVLLVLLAVLMPQQVAATEVTEPVQVALEDITYSISNGIVTITGYSGTATNIILPKAIEGQPVQIIGSYAFQDCASLTGVVIPDSVQTIDYYAFDSCTKLESVTIGCKVQTIGSYAFRNCTNLTAVTVPDSVTSIGYEAFSGCKVLKDVVIGNGVKTIYEYAFCNCVILEDIIIPDSVTSIGNYAFESCTKLTEIVFDGNAPSISNYAFRGVTARAYYPEDNITWTTSVMKQYGGTLSWMPHYRLAGKVDRWNVSLSDDLQVNFYLKINQTIESTARVRIYVGDNSVTYRVSKLEKTEDGRYIAPICIAAAQMSDYIFVTVLNGSHIGNTMTYTVRQYADTILADESFSEYHTLVKEMLNYGAAAQTYFDYEADNLANSGITDTGMVEIPSTVDNALSISGEADGVAFYGASLVFRDKIAVRYYFQFVGAINEYKFIANGKSCTPQLKNGLFYVEVVDILPQNLDQKITLTVTDAEGNALTVNYSPMNYIVRMNEKGSDTLKALVKALYNYHLAAKALQTQV